MQQPTNQQEQLSNNQQLQQMAVNQQQVQQQVQQQQLQQQIQQQMMLCPVRLVYETQILVQPGDQIQPNQTIFINSQNQPPWMQNRQQQQHHNQVLYVPQMQNQMVSSIQPQIDQQNQLIIQQNFGNYQQLLQQQMMAQQQEQLRPHMQIANVMHPSMLQNIQNIQTIQNAQDRNNAQNVQNFQQAQVNLVQNSANAMHQQMNIVPNIVTNNNRQFIANVQQSTPMQNTIGQNVVHSPVLQSHLVQSPLVQSQLVQTNAQKPEQQNQVFYRAIGPPSSQPQVIRQQIAHVVAKNQSTAQNTQQQTSHGQQASQQISQVGQQVPQQVVQQVPQQVGQNFGQIRQMQVQNVGNIPQHLYPNMQAANPQNVLNIRKPIPAMTIVKTSNIVTPTSNSDVRTIYRPIQPRPQQQFKGTLPQFAPTNVQIQPLTQMQNISQNFPNQAKNNFVVTSQNQGNNTVNIIPINTNVNVTPENHNKQMNRKRKSESPDEVQQKKVTVNSSTQVTGNIGGKVNNANNAQFPKIPNDVGMATIQKLENKINQNTLQSNAANITTANIKHEHIKPMLQQATGLANMNYSKMVIKPEPMKQVNTMTKDSTVQTDKEKQVRNTVFTQARGRLLSDKEVNTDTMKISQGTSVTNTAQGTQVTNVSQGIPATSMPQGTQVTNIPQVMTVTNIPQVMTITNMPQGVPLTNASQAMPVNNIAPGMVLTNMPQGTQPTNVQGMVVSNVSQGIPIANVSQGMVISNVPQGTTVSNVPQGIATTNVSQGMVISNVPQGIPMANVSQGMAVTNVPHGNLVTNVSQGIPPTNTSLSMAVNASQSMAVTNVSQGQFVTNTNSNYNIGNTATAKDMSKLLPTTPVVKETVPVPTVTSQPQIITGPTENTAYIIQHTTLTIEKEPDSENVKPSSKSMPDLDIKMKIEEPKPVKIKTEKIEEQKMEETISTGAKVKHENETIEKDNDSDDSMSGIRKRQEVLSQNELPHKKDRDFILTHVLDGFVIQESNIAFPIRKPLKERTLIPNAKAEQQAKEQKEIANLTVKEEVKNSKLLKISNLNINENTDADVKENEEAEVAKEEAPVMPETPFGDLKSSIVKSWTVEQLCLHLSKYEWSETISVLREHEIDGESLFLVTKPQLVHIGVKEDHADTICEFVKS